MRRSKLSVILSKLPSDIGIHETEIHIFLGSELIDHIINMPWLQILKLYLTDFEDPVISFIWGPLIFNPVPVTIK